MNDSLPIVTIIVIIDNLYEASDDPWENMKPLYERFLITEQEIVGRNNTFFIISVITSFRIWIIWRPYPYPRGFARME